MHFLFYLSNIKYKFFHITYSYQNKRFLLLIAPNKNFIDGYLFAHPEFFSLTLIKFFRFIVIR